MTPNSFSKKLRGLTLIEALLFLGIAAIVIVGAVAFYNNANNATKINQAKTQIQAIASGIRSLYASQASYNTVDTSLVINAGIAPKNAVDGNRLINPWGGGTVITGAARTFEIRFNQVPNDACVDLLSAGLLNEGSIISMQVGSTTFTSDADPAAAISSCNAGNSSVRFTVR